MRNRFDIPMLMEEFLRAEVDFDMKEWQDCRCAEDLSSDGATNIKCCL